jgi:hypothetical protein
VPGYTCQKGFAVPLLIIILLLKLNPMKKALLLLPFLLLLCPGCKKIDQLLTFEISEAQDITIPASSLLSIPIIAPVPVTANSKQRFENNNTKAELVKDVRLTKLTLTIVDPAAENFDFLKSIRIYIGTDQNDKVLLASLDNVPTATSSIELLSENTKLDTYIKAPSYTLYTEVSLRSSVARELKVLAESRFRVTADPL